MQSSAMASSPQDDCLEQGYVVWAYMFEERGCEEGPIYAGSSHEVGEVS